MVLFLFFLKEIVPARSHLHSSQPPAGQREVPGGDAGGGLPGELAQPLSSPPPARPLSSGAAGRPLGRPCPPGPWGQRQPCGSHPGSRGCISGGRGQGACGPGAHGVNSGSQADEKFLRKVHLGLLEVNCWQGPRKAMGAPTCCCVVRKWKFNCARHQFSSSGPIFMTPWLLFLLCIPNHGPSDTPNTRIYSIYLLQVQKKMGGGILNLIL